jgi:hypothetical protein
MYSLTGMTSLGTIENESSSKSAQLFQQPMPVSDSNQAILLDLFGASRTIQISGRFYEGQDSMTVTDFIAELDGLISGSQTAKTYFSDKTGVSYTVLVDGVSWKVTQGEVTIVSYDITLIEGSA